MADAVEQRTVPIRLAGEPPFRLGHLVFEPATRQVRHEAKSLTIEPRVMQVLVALARANTTVVGRDMLIAQCWDGRIVGDNAINRVISLIRQLAEKFGDAQFRVETITKVGYRLTPSDAKSTGVESAPPEVGRMSSASVAILPFANLTGDPALEYVGDGLAEELIATLSRACDLRVPARTSTFAYKGRDADIRRIASDLGVETVLEGSVRTAGTRIRATAQLIDAKTGFHLWTESYERELRDLFDLQDEIAGAIARELKAKLGIETRRPVDPEAYHLYLQAIALMARSAPDDVSHAITLLDQAIARDPTFASAWARHASALLMASNVGRLPFEARTAARAKAEQALRLDPTLATAHMVLGGLAGLEGRWLEAESALRTALALDVGESTIHHMTAFYVFGPCGRLADAQAQVRRAFELAPADALQSLGQATLAAYRGDDRSIVKHHLQTAMLLGMAVDEPAIRQFLAEGALGKGRIREAVAHMAMALPPPLLAAGGTEVAALVYRALGGTEDTRAASAAIDRLLDATDADDQLWRYQIAAGTLLNWQVRLGALDPAFAVADRFVAAWERSGQLATMGLFQLWLPEARAFRADPRFSRFAERLGMFGYWAQHGPPDGYELEQGRLIGR